MYDCIYTPHCTRFNCDLACPLRAEISYWMERCRINMDNPVLNSSDKLISEATKIIESSLGSVMSIQCKDTMMMGDLLSYIAICLHGTGVAFTDGIYKLNLSEYIDEIKRSWQTKVESDSLEYMRIWTESERYLIINGLDYIKFGDFESQTLLQIIQSRRSPKKATLIISPDTSHLVGSSNSAFFTMLIDKLEEVKVK